MDALKLIAGDSVKADAPAFSIGDTVRVDVKIREGDRERIQAFEARSLPRRAVALPRPLRFAVWLTVSAWREFSRCTAPMLPPSRWFATVRFAAANCIICVIAWVRLLRLKN